MIENDFDIADIEKRFSYDADTGAIRNRKSGRIVGGRDGGYLSIWVSSTKRIRAHRIAWALYYGEWPTTELDHINGNGLDNRIENLRSANRVLQSQNVAISKNSKTKIIGVCPCKQTGKFKATININGRQIWLGRYPTIEMAAAARKSAEEKLGWNVRKL